MGRTAILTQVPSRPSGLPLLWAVRAMAASRSLISQVSTSNAAGGALATRKVTVRPHSVVHSLVFDPTSRSR